jgi:hypothetical protein
MSKQLQVVIAPEGVVLTPNKEGLAAVFKLPADCSEGEAGKALSYAIKMLEECLNNGEEYVCDES